MEDLKECAVYLTTQILTGEITNIRKETLGNTDREREETAKEILRYAVKTYLYDYTAEELYVFADMNLLNKLGFARIYEICIEYAKKNNEEEKVLDINKNDYKYLTKIVYPEFYKSKIKKDGISEIISDYTLFLEKKKKLPPEYFRLGLEGRDRLLLCLNYVITEKLNFFSLEDLYLTFADSKEAKKILRRFRLTDNDYYADIKNPLDFMYKSIPTAQKDEDLLNELKAKQMKERRSKNYGKNERFNGFNDN